MAKEKHYQDVGNNPDLPKIEEKILEFWKKEQVFGKSVDERDPKNEWVFYDGPPFANGLPHYGHLLTSCVKDIFPRYHTMKGKKVERRFGWDCHGLPAEMESEKELGISGQIAIQEHGIGKFNEHCRTSVMKYTDEWQHYVNRQARWVDFEHDYKTMDISYMESVMWAFKQLFDKGLVYEGHRVMPYSWACETPLSNFETRMDNSYREIEDKAITVKFNLKDKPEIAPDGCESYKILAWTTTPWTLPSNLALAVNPEMDYVAVKTENGECLIIAKFALANYTKELGLEEGAELPGFKGSKLVGLSYEPLLPYFENHPNSFKVFSGDFVEEGSGTGIVHLAPGFGEDDQRVCEENGIDLVCPVDQSGKFTHEVTDFEGQQVFETNVPIIKRLKEEGKWLKTEQYMHNYPHCWRTDTPLIYKAVPSWYVKVTQFKDRMVELNQNINWIPGHVKDGLFGKWLENAHDWSISRNRFWGAPIPVWKSNNPKNDKLYVYGSIEEIEKDFGVKVEDLHRPFIDTLTRPDPEDENYTLTRVTEVLDCWFESGSMPFAQVHYPFENKDWFEEHFPADFIVEYTAQTRGWFYTLMVLGTALFDKEPFKNCICHGVILDENSQKLSKRLRNYPDPMEMYDQYGADAMRWMMVSGPVMHGGELLVHKDGDDVRDVVRLTIKPIWNAYNFFTLYANTDGVKAKEITSSDNVMDSYILAKVKAAVGGIEKELDNFDIPNACKIVDEFFEVLNNWYIRRNRNRFWREADSEDIDKQAAYDTLYTVLTIMCRAVAPLLPFVTEEIFKGLTGELSVHLQDYPDTSAIADNNELIANMDKVRDACNASLGVRNIENIRIRQPLQSVTLYGDNVEQLSDYRELIADELNVKEVNFSNELEAIAARKLQVNFPVAGKRLGPKMKDIIAATKAGEWKAEGDKIAVAGELLEGEEFNMLLEAKVEKGAAPLSTNDALVVLDLNLSEELLAEGIARDIVRIIQQARKDADLHVSDRINLVLEANNKVKLAVESNKNYIAEQTLATSLDFGEAKAKKHINENELEGEKLVIGFEVAA